MPFAGSPHGCGRSAGHGSTVRARVAGAEDAAVGQPQDRTGVPHAVGIVLVERRSPRGRRAPARWRGPVSKRPSTASPAISRPQVLPRSQRGAAIASPGSIPKRAMRVKICAWNCGWPSPPMRAVGHHPPIVEAGERRVERVEGLPARHQRVDRVLVERKAHAAVLPEDAGPRQHDARAELPEDRLDEGDRPALLVDGAEPDRVALLVRRRQRRPPACGRRDRPRGRARRRSGIRRDRCRRRDRSPRGRGR